MKIKSICALTVSFFAYVAVNTWFGYWDKAQVFAIILLVYVVVFTCPFIGENDL